MGDPKLLRPMNIENVLQMRALTALLLWTLLASCRGSRPVTTTNVSGTYGVLQSENHPQPYSNNIHHIYTITVAEHNNIVLDFTAFDTEFSRSCRFDYILVRDGDGSELLGRTCGSSLPPNITSATNVVAITFITDSVIISDGWRVVWRVESLLIMPHHAPGSDCCSVLSTTPCVADVFPDAYNAKSSITLPCSERTFNFSLEIPPDGHLYKSDIEGEQVLITWNSATQEMYGNIVFDLNSFLLLQGNRSQHFWSAEEEGEYIRNRAGDGNPNPEPISDNTTPFIYTTTVYYTKQAEIANNDFGIFTFINELIAQTNDGYMHSNVPLKLQLHCALESNITEVEDETEMLNKFENHYGDAAKGRKTADTAVLLVAKLNACGIAVPNSITNGKTMAVVRTTCAKKYFSFGHELGHTAGLMHDREGRPDHMFGRGHIWVGSDLKVYASILAGYQGKTRVNRYSNPALRYKGNATGFEDPNNPLNKRNANNAKVLRMNRKALSLVGDETQACPIATLTSTGK